MLNPKTELRIWGWIFSADKGQVALLSKSQIPKNKHSWSDFISGAYCEVINMNPNQAFCFAFAILLLQIIDMQQQQMFAFSSSTRDG